MIKKRKVAVFTGNRAEYGLQSPVLEAIKSHPFLDYRLIVSGAHLDNNFGKTLKEIKFGQALIFNTNNYHYIPINKTNKTRWAINLRLKNLFTPYGERNLLDYYEILKISPLSKMYTN